jgi:flavin reductase (DIM6/NTAB) family NADH-FMN oxidoreductase RutF/rubredoxin
MKNPKITRKITQGVYVLTTKGGGCIVDAVSRASAGEQPLIAVAVAKTNHSHKLLSENDRFALSVLGEDVDAKIIETFGFKSSKDIDKCTECQTTDIEGVPVLENSIGYMVCEKVDAIDAETHTIYIGRMIEADVLKDERPMTYAWYQEHKGDLVKVKTEENKTAWVCMACGYVYYGDEVPDDYKCPLCGLGKEYFKKKD